MISTDKGKNFVTLSGINGTILDMTYDSNAFWAVGNNGFAAKAAVKELEELSPSKLAWETLNLGVTNHFSGISLSFGRGFIVGSVGSLLSTENQWTSFSDESGRTNGKDIIASNQDFFVGNEIFGSKEVVSGAPAGSYQWHVKISSETPTLRSLLCFSTCLAVGGRSKDGNGIYKLDKDGNVLEVLASGLPKIPKAIRNIQKGNIVVGENGLILTLSE